MKKISQMAGVLVFSLFFTCCATESQTRVKVERSESAETARNYRGVRSPLMVGKFDNHSNYMRGIFSDGPDKLSSQAKTVLISHLQQTGRFSVMDRSNMEELAGEAKFKGKTQKIKGADYIITGDVAEFGRKDVGDQQLFGVLGSGKKQVAYAKVTLNVVDVMTSEVVYSASGAGEYVLSSREVLGFGGRSGYDSTLNGKVLDLAMREGVDRLVEGLEQGLWTVSHH